MINISAKLSFRNRIIFLQFRCFGRNPDFTSGRQNFLPPRPALFVKRAGLRDVLQDNLAEI